MILGLFLLGTAPVHAVQTTDIRIVSNSQEPEKAHWVTFSAFLTCGDSLPTGKVNFSVDHIQVAQAEVTDGMALLGIAFSTGNHVIEADYPGDSSCGQGHGSMNQLVVAAFGITVQSSVNPSTIGQAVTFAIQMTCGAGVTKPVTIRSDGTIIGTTTLTPLDPFDAQGEFTTSSLPVGTHTIQAQYDNGNTGGCATPATTTQIVTANTVTWCNLATDGRLNSDCGDRIVLYCNSDVKPANLDIWVVDDNSVGHDLTTIPLEQLSAVPMGQYVEALGSNGILFAGLDSDGNGYAALQGGPYNATGKGDWGKTFSCKKAS